MRIAIARLDGARRVLAVVPQASAKPGEAEADAALVYAYVFDRVIDRDGVSDATAGKARSAVDALRAAGAIAGMRSVILAKNGPTWAQQKQEFFDRCRVGSTCK